MIGLAPVVAGLASASRGTGGGPRLRARAAPVACGVERWPVKILADRPRLLPPRRSTVRLLGVLRVPAGLGPSSSRRPAERTVATVTARLLRIRAEADGDLHAILADPVSGATMIAEFPDPACTVGARPRDRARMRAARLALASIVPPARVRVTGVLFFDLPHGQDGIAPNAVEIHPVLALSR